MVYSRKKSNFSYENLISKAMKYCAYQERCISDLRNKLFEWNAGKNNINKIIDQMLDEGFINERRYLEVYIKGKVNIKRWGKYKIKSALKAKKIDEAFINEFLDKIDEKVYISNIEKASQMKLSEVSNESKETKKQKLYRFLLSRGYESELISSMIPKIVSEE